MPAASEIVCQYARYYAFAFNLNITRPVFERAPDWTIVPGLNPILLRGLSRAATARPNQGAYNERGNVDPFHRQCISRRCLSVTAELYLNRHLAAAEFSRSNPTIYWASPRGLANPTNAYFAAAFTAPAAFSMIAATAFGCDT